MKSREVKLVKFIKDKTGIDFKLCKNDFSTYDAENKDYIVELKIRDTSYPTKAIEVIKCYSLIQLAEVKNKMAIYVVGDSNGVHIFNLSNQAKEIMKLKIEKVKMPYQTELEKNVKINKYVYMLPEGMSKKII